MRASQIAEHVFSRFGLRPRIGLELEFYVVGSGTKEFLSPARDALMHASPLLDSVSTEDGDRQFEYALRESEDLDALIAAIQASNRAIEELAHSLGGRVLWDAMPFPRQPSSGLHVHITLHDRAGTNQLAKPCADGPESSVMLACVAGLLSTMRPLMIAFAPSENCYLRIRPRPYPEVMFSPTTVSWGADNRSVALRLPGSQATPHRRRIEHRVASAAADVEVVLVAILAGIWVGLAAGQPPSQPKTLGLANQPVATEPPFPASRDEAQKLFASVGAPLLVRLADELDEISITRSSANERPPLPRVDLDANSQGCV